MNFLIVRKGARAFHSHAGQQGVDEWTQRHAGASNDRLMELQLRWETIVGSRISKDQVETACQHEHPVASPAIRACIAPTESSLNARS